MGDACNDIGYSRGLLSHLHRHDWVVRHCLEYKRILRTKSGNNLCGFLLRGVFMKRI